VISVKDKLPSSKYRVKKLPMFSTYETYCQVQAYERGLGPITHIWFNLRELLRGQY